MSRAGSIVFWKSTTSASRNPASLAIRAGIASIAPAGALLSGGVLLVAFGEPVTEFAGATAAQLMRPYSYVSGVLGDGDSTAPLTEEP